MNTFAFADEGSTGTDNAAIEAYEKEDGDNIASQNQIQVPDNWSINSNPATWDTATKIISVNGPYYGGKYTEYKYSSYYQYESLNLTTNTNYIEFKSYENLTRPEDDEDIKNYIIDNINPDSLGYYDDEVGEFVNEDPKNLKITILDFDFMGQETQEGTNWTVYSPFSYFFQNTNTHLVDGKLVSITPHKGDTNCIYRAIPAGTDTFVLVKVAPYRDYADLGEDIVVYADDVKGEKRVEQRFNTRYNGDEPMVTYSGLKLTNATFKTNGDLNFKKGEDPVFVVDAVLIKSENGKNTVVKGLSVKSVKFKNNVAASFPEDADNDLIGDYEAGKGGTYYNNYYKITENKDGEITDVAFVGPSYKNQLTKAENANFKGQPSFTVDFAVKGDAKKYAKDVKKAAKDAKATFNFEINQLNIGNYLADKGTYTKEIEYNYKEDEYSKADSDHKKAVDSYVQKYADAVLNDSSLAGHFKKKEEAVKYVSENMIKNIGVNIEPNHKGGFKQFIGKIQFTNIPLYVDKDIDAEMTEKGRIDGVGATQLEVLDGDPKNLKFSKGNKVSAKLKLMTTVQWEYTPTDMVAGGFSVEKEKELFATAKTTPKAGGTADVFLKGLTVTDAVEGEIPFAVAIGQNNLTGAITMRNYEDNHGDEAVRYGHYKADDSFYVDSED